MIIPGYINWDDAAYIDVLVHLHRRKLRGKISFMIDTGVDRSLLSERDAMRLGLAFKGMRTSNERLLGIGGMAKVYYVSQASLQFFSEHGNFTRRLKRLYVMRSLDLPPELRNVIPSLMGRDMLRHFLVHLDIRNGDLEFEPARMQE